MIRAEDISSLNDDEIESEKILKIKNEAKKDIALSRKIRLIRKVSYLTRNIMISYKNRLTFDITERVLKRLFPFN